MSELQKTVLYDKHVSSGATLVDFGGWNMPIQYPAGIIEEHLTTRKKAGLFDVSHMGRFIIKGLDSLSFLQYALLNNASALDIGQAQYTMIQNKNGGAVDDAYLYRFVKDEYILVVNASNQKKDWNHLQLIAKKFKDLDIENNSDKSSMISLQGPLSKTIISSIIEEGQLPEPVKNALSIVKIKGNNVLLARTGYTGEPLGFELFMDNNSALDIWDLLIQKGATPVGLGARDTLRLEAGLPLYGHELGTDIEGKEIQIFACPLSRLASSFSPVKGEFLGKEPLLFQFEALKKIINQDYSLIKTLPRIVMPVAILGKGVGRSGFKVFKDDKLVGYITSGTMVPYWKTTGEGLETKLLDEKGMRAICLALLDSNLKEDDKIIVDIRGNKVEAVIVPFHLRTDTPPYARPIIYGQGVKIKKPLAATYQEKVKQLLTKTIENTNWRQKECINLIPSEMTPSPLVRLLSIMDPSFRYAEHKKIKSFYDIEVFYYQGTNFINEVEELLIEEMKKYFGCKQIETRIISGQMANTATFSALIDYLNIGDKKSEPQKIQCVLNNHIIRGGHLSAQPMGALHNFVKINPKTDKPAVINFPVLSNNPYKIDVSKTKTIIEEYKPELIIFGKSMVLHPEPLEEIRTFIDAQKIESIIMYDMAHVLGLIGPYFQEPFKEGADIVTGSTHKTFFGTQRGVIAGNLNKHDKLYHLWEFIENRTFPGSVSNHHLGTLLGLLLATYEMNYFKDEYQKNVIDNAKTLAKALKDLGIDVAGDSAVSFTETHQVIVNVGYLKGPEIAKRLEENNIIVNYQVMPGEEGFTASSAIRMGVSEMTRFGMKEKDFKCVAQFLHDVIIKNKNINEEVKKFRQKFLDLRFCFKEKEFENLIQKLHQLV
ncbi:MAG: glycine cleavage system aminomethyltransferase GcvT [Candidatus Firestonebacteria bacterium]